MSPSFPTALLRCREISDCFNIFHRDLRLLVRFGDSSIFTSSFLILTFAPFSRLLWSMQVSGEAAHSVRASECVRRCQTTFCACFAYAHAVAAKLYLASFNFLLSMLIVCWTECSWQVHNIHNPVAFNQLPLSDMIRRWHVCWKYHELPTVHVICWV